MPFSPQAMLIFCLLAVGAAFVIGLCVGLLSRGAGAATFGWLHENRGEGDVRRLLARHFDGELSHPMHNITLPCGDGTTQINHVLVSTKGIFVIETKHYTGWIFAHAHAPQWTQVIYKHKFRFQNPLRQNYKHVKAVEDLLDFVPAQHIHSLVVFTGDAQFKTEQPDNVVHLNKLAERLCCHDAEVLSPNKLHICVGRIECRRRLVSRRTDVEHQAYLARKYDSLT